jgi:hypothetical protein
MYREVCLSCHLHVATVPKPSVTSKALPTDLTGVTVTCGIIRLNRNCAYLVLLRERHVDVLSLNFPLPELFTLNL